MPWRFINVFQISAKSAQSPPRWLLVMYCSLSSPFLWWLSFLKFTFIYNSFGQRTQFQINKKWLVKKMVSHLSYSRSWKMTCNIQGVAQFQVTNFQICCSASTFACCLLACVDCWFIYWLVVLFHIPLDLGSWIYRYERVEWMNVSSPRCKLG